MAPPEPSVSLQAPGASTLGSRTDPRSVLEDLWWYLDMTPEERDLEIQRACRTAMDQWLALPESERIRWPPEPGPAGDEILARWAKECREGHPSTPQR